MIDGDDLVALRVRGSALGVRADAPVRIASFLTSAEDARRVLAPLAQGARVVLTLPAHWTSLRPIALTSAKWAGAREEVLRSVQGLFPLAADAAMVGLIDRGDAGDD
ncbi:MAG TPA: hypothetical protein DEB06_05055, partial [Phycisphaerales bacterium]|nr:hypothetical protein [Phycisphaerales bacterium]